MSEDGGVTSSECEADEKDPGVAQEARLRREPETCDSQKEGPGPPGNFLRGNPERANKNEELV